MPTGYTSDLYEGKEITFEQFVLKCARAMGALIEMRDDGPDAPIPEAFEVSDYYVERVAKAREKLISLQQVSMEEWTERERLDRDEANAGRADYLSKGNGRVERYEQMLAQVEAWTPPTSEHEGFKKFMVEQLEGSIKFDAPSTRFYPVIEERDPLEFMTDQIAAAAGELNNAKKSLAEEQERIAGRNAWVAALRESLSERV